MDHRQVTARRRLPPARPVIHSYHDDRTRVSINPMAILIFILAMAVLFCLAQLGWKVTLCLVGIPLLLRLAYLIALNSWEIVTTLSAWEMDISDAFALAQGITASRESKLEKRMQIADHDAKVRVLMRGTRYANLHDLRALMVTEAGGEETLLYGQCFDLWNKDRSWGTGFKMALKHDVASFYKVIRLGVGTVERAIEHQQDRTWSYQCLYLATRNHWLVYIIARIWFPSHDLEVVDQYGDLLSGTDALNYIRNTMRSA